MHGADIILHQNNYYHYTHNSYASSLLKYVRNVRRNIQGKRAVQAKHFIFYSDIIIVCASCFLIFRSDRVALRGKIRCFV